MKSKQGFIWTFDHLDSDGREVETIHNIMPTEALDFWINVLLGIKAPFTQWYIGLFSGDYLPLPTDKASTFPGLANEFVGYEDDFRRPFTPEPAVNGEANNSHGPTVFTFTQPATIYGGFITSAHAGGTEYDVLLSAVRFPTPKVKEATSALRVTVSLGLISDD